MKKEPVYPAEDDIISLNLLALSIIPAKKSDKAEVLSKAKITSALDACKNFDGDIYSKAAVMLTSLVRAHAFASGNRRTAFLAAKEFLLNNGAKFSIKDDPHHSRVLLGVREGFYSIDELKEWIQHGKIRDFKRH